MALCPIPSFEIPRPPIEAPLHGLLDVAYEPDLSAFPASERDRWESGITFYPNPGTCDHVTPWLDGSDSPQDKPTPGANVDPAVYYSFKLIYTTACQATNKDTLEANIDAAKDALVVGSGQAVEAILWGPGDGGILDAIFDAGNFSLSGATPLVTGAAGMCSGIVNPDGATSGAVAMSPKQALLALTQALGNCALGARGIIHAPAYVAEDWASQSLIVPSDVKDPASNLITNVRGDYVVGGSGYTGVGPSGHALETPAEGHAWVYATGPVGVLLSEPQYKDTTHIDHRTNIHTIIVERSVAIAVNPTCIFAAYVDVA